MKAVLTFILSIVFGTISVAQTKYDIQFNFEGRSRELIVSVPTKLPPTEGYPVVFMLHGTSGDKDVFYNVKGWKELGQSENFITVFPSSLKWCFVEDGIVKNTTRFVCGGLIDSICPKDIPDLINDVAFFRKIVDLMEDTVKINKKKIFISGFSNGSCMMHKVAMDAGDLFSAGAGSSSPLHSLDSLTPKKRIPVWYMVGTKDDRFFTEKFPTELPYGEDSILIFHQKAINRALVCQGLTSKFTKVETAINKTYTWTECRPGEVCAPYIFTINKNQTHQYPNGNNYPLDAPKLFWEFFNNPPVTTMSTDSKEVISASYVTLQPNPASQLLTIFTGNSFDEKWEYSIYTMQGQFVMSKENIQTPEYQLDIQALPTGLYTVLVTNATGTVIQKLLKY